MDSLFGEILQARGLILDLRENGGGNSGTGFRILDHLTPDSFAVGEWATLEYRPLDRARGRGAQERKEPSLRWPPHGGEPFRGPVAVLIGPRTGSAAEDFCVAFDLMNRGVLVGEPTTGSTGQPLGFSLPGGGSGQVCTAHCYYPGGKEFVGVGVMPQLLIRQTVADIREGRDPVLEAAARFAAGEEPTGLPARIPGH